MSVTVEETGTFSPATVVALAAVAEQARAADGAAPFSDDLWAQAKTARTSVALHITEDNGQLVGAAFVGRQGDRAAAEVLVAPPHRGAGHGGALVAALLGTATGELWVWSHGDHPAARILADRHRLDRVRELLQLRRGLGPGTAPLPEPQPPAGLELRTFVVGQDEPAWLDVNNAAFAWHPEQGHLTLEDVRTAEAASWFDPQGFFLAVRDDQIVGYHWTKVHPRDPSPAPGADHADAPVGEVYVLGVAPEEHGAGIGRALTAVGLRHLAAQPGVTTVMLYVEGDNAAALAVYERLGFEPYATDVAYRRAAVDG